MPTTAKAPSARTPAPAGTHVGVCVDVVDKGPVETPWGHKPKVVIVWEIDEYSDEYEGRFRVNKQYTNSLHEKANLTQDLESWRGKAFTAEEKQGFDLDKLIGAPCLLNVVHNEANQRIYANVKAVMPLPKGTEAFEPTADYVLVRDRPGGWDVRSPAAEDDAGQNGQQSDVHEQVEQADYVDDDLPF